MPIDMLRPISDDNRPEHILFEYDGYMSNRAEFYAKALMVDEDATHEIHYPRLAEIRKLTGDQLFMATAYFEPEDFFRFLEPNQSLDSIHKQMEYLDKYWKLQHFQRMTSFAAALTKLVSKEYVKRVAFIRKEPLTHYMMSHLDHLFGPKSDKEETKLEFYQGDVESLITDDTEFTSIFMNDVNELYHILTTFPDEKIQNRMFFIRKHQGNLIHDEAKGIFSFRYGDELDKLAEQKKCGISPNELTCLSADPIDKEIMDSGESVG